MIDFVLGKKPESIGQRLVRFERWAWSRSGMGLSGDFTRASSEEVGYYRDEKMNALFVAWCAGLAERGEARGRKTMTQIERIFTEHLKKQDQDLRAQFEVWVVAELIDGVPLAIKQDLTLSHAEGGPVYRSQITNLLYTSWLAGRRDGQRAVRAVDPWATITSNRLFAHERDDYHTYSLDEAAEVPSEWAKLIGYQAKVMKQAMEIPPELLTEKALSSRPSEPRPAARTSFHPRPRVYGRDGAYVEE